MVAHLLLLVAVYLLIWQFGEPVGIPDKIENLPAFMKSRIFIHLSLTFLIAAYLTLILDLIIRYGNQTPKPNSDKERLLLEKIGFGPSDTPLLSCWSILERTAENE
jgi:hypothetical protein